MQPVRPLTYQDSALETETCVGPRYTRTQPSRESEGILLDSVNDKYIVEYNLPYRNLVRYVKEIDNNWSKLNDDQKALIQKSLNNMKSTGSQQQMRAHSLSNTVSKSPFLSTEYLTTVLILGLIIAYLALKHDFQMFLVISAMIIIVYCVLMFAPLGL